MKRCVFAVALLISLSPGLAGAQQDTTSLAVSDSALIRHIRTAEPLFRTVLGSCTGQSLDRSRSGSHLSFVYRATCAIRRPPSEAGACARYLIEASGAIDSPTWASVREWRLKLECSA